MFKTKSRSFRDQWVKDSYVFKWNIMSVWRIFYFKKNSNSFNSDVRNFFQEWINWYFRMMTEMIFFKHFSCWWVQLSTGWFQSGPNSLWPYDNIDLGQHWFNAFMVGTKPLPEPMLIYLWLVLPIDIENPYCRDSPTVWPLCVFFFILLLFYVPFYVKKKKNDNFMCLLEVECAKRLKAHSRAIPDIDYRTLCINIYRVLTLSI